MARSELTVDLGAIRRNARRLLGALDGAELWAVVKADGYGHGAVDVGAAALGAGATALCVATVPEGLALRRALGPVRILVMGPASSREIAEARDAGLELVVVDGEIPEGVRVHLKLDTGMGRWGLAELPAPTREVVGVDEPLRLRRLRRRLHGAAGGAVPGRDRRALLPDPAPGEQRRRVALPVGALRRCALRDRPLRDLAVRHRPGGGRARAGAALGLAARAGATAAAGASPRATAAASSRSGRPGSGSSRSAMRTASAAA